MILTAEQVEEYEKVLKQVAPNWPDRNAFVPQGQLFRGTVVANACFEIRDLLDTIHYLKENVRKPGEPS